MYANPNLTLSPRVNVVKTIIGSTSLISLFRGTKGFFRQSPVFACVIFWKQGRQPWEKIQDSV